MGLGKLAFTEWLDGWVEDPYHVMEFGRTGFEKAILSKYFLEASSDVQARVSLCK